MGFWELILVWPEDSEEQNMFLRHIALAELMDLPKKYHGWTEMHLTFVPFDVLPKL